MCIRDREWTVSLVKDSVDKTSKHYNEKSARAKLMSRNTQTQQWGNDVPKDQLAHNQDNVECYACHTSWTTSCGGCHLPSEANWKTEGHHYEGAVARVFATYNLSLIHISLKEYFSHQYLGQDALRSSQITKDQLRRPNVKNKTLSIEDRKQAMDWAEKQSLIIAQDLIEKRVCIDCHHISKIPGKTEFEKWYVKPVALNKKWMPLADFNHAKHTGVSCATCHKNAKESKRSSDILIPKIETCRGCHGGKKDKYKLPSDCLMCHKFHLPNRGLFDKAQQTAAEKSLASKNLSNTMDNKE